MFSKSVLRLPHRDGNKKRVVIHSLISTCLRQWQDGDLVQNYGNQPDSMLDFYAMFGTTTVVSNATLLHGRAMNLSKHSRYGQATQCLSSLGCALDDDVEVFQELLERHPSHSLPNLSINCPPPLIVDYVTILSALKAFPRGTSPDGSKL